MKRILLLGATGFIGNEIARAGLPPLYHRYFRIWFAYGFPAFAAVLAIVWLMLARQPA